MHGVMHAFPARALPVRVWRDAFITEMISEQRGPGRGEVGHLWLGDIESLQCTKGGMAQLFHFLTGTSPHFAWPADVHDKGLLRRVLTDRIMKFARWSGVRRKLDGTIEYVCFELLPSGQQVKDIVRHVQGAEVISGPPYTRNMLRALVSGS